MRCGSSRSRASSSKQLCARGCLRARCRAGSPARPAAPPGGRLPMVARARRREAGASLPAISPAISSVKHRLLPRFPCGRTSPTLAQSGIWTGGLLDQEPPGTRSETIVDHSHGACMTPSRALRKPIVTSPKSRNQVTACAALYFPAGQHGKRLFASGCRTSGAAVGEQPSIDGMGESMVRCRMRNSSSSSDPPRLSSRARSRLALVCANCLSRSFAFEFPGALHQVGVPHPHHVAPISDLHGNARLEMHREFEFKRDRFQSVLVHLVRECRTHLDAPIHFSQKAGLSADKGVRARGGARCSACGRPTWSIRPSNRPTILLGPALRPSPNVHPSTALPALLAFCVALSFRLGRARISRFLRARGRERGGCQRTCTIAGFRPEAGRMLLNERHFARPRGRHQCRSTTVLRGEFKTPSCWLPSGRWGLENVANLDKVGGGRAPPWWSAPPM